MDSSVRNLFVKNQSTLVGFINQYSSREKKPRGWKTGLVTADDVRAEGRAEKSCAVEVLTQTGKQQMRTK
jgi:hypothetical protein